MADFDEMRNAYLRAIGVVSDEGTKKDHVEDLMQERITLFDEIRRLEHRLFSVEDEVIKWKEISDGLATDLDRTQREFFVRQPERMRNLVKYWDAGGRAGTSAT